MVDARGESCPIPVVMTLKEIDTNSPDELEVYVDSMVCVENVTRLANTKGYNVEVEEKDGDYILKLKK